MERADSLGLLLNEIDPDAVPPDLIIQSQISVTSPFLIHESHFRDKPWYNLPVSYKHVPKTLFTCVCGCGRSRPARKGARHFNAACRQRAKRARTTSKLASILTLR